MADFRGYPSHKSYQDEFQTGPNTKHEVKDCQTIERISEQENMGRVRRPQVAPNPIYVQAKKIFFGELAERCWA